MAQQKNIGNLVQRINEAQRTLAEVSEMLMAVEALTSFVPQSRVTSVEPPKAATRPSKQPRRRLKRLHGLALAEHTAVVKAEARKVYDTFLATKKGEKFRPSEAISGKLGKAKRSAVQFHFRRMVQNGFMDATGAVVPPIGKSVGHGNGAHYVKL